MKRLLAYLDVLWNGSPDRLTKERVLPIPEPLPDSPERVSMPGARRRKNTTHPARIRAITD